MWNYEEENKIGKFRWWLLQKGYSRQTAINYDRNMRRAEREGLTSKSVGDIYWGYSRETRTHLRRAVTLLEEYYE